MRRRTEDKMAKLLADKAAELKATDGRDRVAIAIASINPKVTVDARGGSLTVTPANLFAQRLGDPRVGVNNKAAVERFKASLVSQMPEHAAALRALPADPGLQVSSVAQYVAALLRGKAAVSPTVTTPSWTAFQTPTIMVKSASAEARTRVGNLFGKELAGKASNRLVQALTVASGFGRETAVGGRPVIVEMNADPVPAAAAAVEAGREAFAAAGFRQTAINAARDLVYQQCSPIRAELDRRAPVSGGGREAVSPPAFRTDICWLNRTMRTRIEPRALAEVAGDSIIQRLGLPRLLQRELSISAVSVGAVAFRAAHSVNGSAILVAVIDGEVDVNHRFLLGRVLHKANFTNEPFGSPDAHGTAVAGIIASAQPNLPGIAPAARIANYKIFPTNSNLAATDFDGALALQRALEDGARIANCSWGSGPAGNGTSREARACNTAWSLGLFIVKSAGNNGPGEGTMTSPADADGVIVVGATDRKGKGVQSYSSRGNLSGKVGPDVVAPGGTPADGIRTLLTGGGSGAAGHGTSFAAPHVSGLAALLLGRHPDATPDETRTALAQACTAFAVTAVAAQGRGLVKI